MHADIRAAALGQEDKGTCTSLPHPRGLIGNLRLLWCARATLERAAFLGLVAATLVAFIVPARYRSTAQLMPPDTNSTSGMAMMAALSVHAGDMLGSVPGDMLAMKTSGALFIGVLNSRTVQDRIVDRFELRKTYGYKLQEDARQKLFDNTSIFEDRKSGIITIAVSDHDRRRATAMAQAYVDQLNGLISELSTSSAHRERVFLEQRIAEVKKDLNQVSQQFSEFSSRNTAIDIKEQGRAMIEATSMLTGQLIAAESELSGLKQIYNSNNVRVRSTEARVAELRRRIAQLRGQENTDGLPDDLPSLRRLPQIGVTYSDLYRQTKTQEAVYETLTEQYELAKVQEAKETPSVKTLDAPDLPERRSYPPRLQIMLAGIFLGITGASAWVLTKSHWEQLDNSSPGKALAQELATALNSRMPWAPPNGSRIRAVAHRAWVRFGPGRNGVAS